MQRLQNLALSITLGQTQVAHRCSIRQASTTFVNETYQTLQALADTHTALLRVHKELEALKRLSEVAVAAAAYGVDKGDTVARSQRLVQRAASLQKVSIDVVCVFIRTR